MEGRPSKAVVFNGLAQYGEIDLGSPSKGADEAIARNGLCLIMFSI